MGNRLLLGVALGWALVASLVFVEPATAQTDEEARALFAAGQVAYDDGRYESALEYFQRAYDLSHRPLLLYNIGSCAEHLRMDQRALDAYHQYLVEVPTAANRSAVESRIGVIERAMAASTSTTTTTTTQVDTPPPEETTTQATTTTTVEPPPSGGDGGPGAAPWILVGIGAAVAIAGAILVGVGMSDFSSVTDAAMGSHWADVHGAYDQAPILTGVGWACLGVGVAAAIGGVVWALVGGGGGGGDHAALPRLQLSGWADGTQGGVLARGSF
jgi:tetratricopeptide (TPR) repeat protein